MLSLPREEPDPGEPQSVEDEVSPAGRNNDTVNTEKAVVLLCQGNEVLDTVECSFRPLVPLLANIGDRLVLFLGSADDSRLRLYEVSRDDGPQLSETSLEGRDIEESLTFDSCVMGLDATTRAGGHVVLAVGCQDGTVRLVLIDNNMQHVTDTTFIIDGPVVSLHLTEAQSRIRLLAGSMCGFAMYAAWEPDVALDGPHMVSDDTLWNSVTGREDSVLAVCSRDALVVVGTHSGRLLAYRRISVPDTRYELFWQCQLPYSVYEIVVAEAREVLVTTRWSLHRFVPCVATVDFDAHMAKTRLQALLQQSK